LLPLVADGGHILNVSSGLARFAVPGLAAYGSLKAAVEMFTIYLAKELGPRKIRANVVAPGPIDTEFGGGKNVEYREQLSSLTALGRIGEADDIGRLIASLLSDDSRWVNAQRIEASGGMNI
jgi:NAD(P)-dependent dehydrogenase (short-subunit alcohol dehydrogenase family)